MILDLSVILRSATEIEIQHSQINKESKITDR